MWSSSACRDVNRRLPPLRNKDGDGVIRWNGIIRRADDRKDRGRKDQKNNDEKEPGKNDYKKRKPEGKKKEGREREKEINKNNQIGKFSSSSKTLRERNTTGIMINHSLSSSSSFSSSFYPKQRKESKESAGTTFKFSPNEKMNKNGGAISVVNSFSNSPERRHNNYDDEQNIDVASSSKSSFVSTSTVHRLQAIPALVVSSVPEDCSPPTSRVHETFRPNNECSASSLQPVVSSSARDVGFSRITRSCGQTGGNGDGGGGDDDRREDGEFLPLAGLKCGHAEGAGGAIMEGKEKDDNDDDDDDEEKIRRPKYNYGRRLSNLVATAAQSQQFFEGLGRMREKEAEENKDKEPIPVFNKRLFAAHGSVVITAEARRLMAQNARTRPDQPFPLMTKSQLTTMRCVVDGLRLIHRGQDHVKDALSHVVSFECYSAYQYIVKRPSEAQLSCYYILHGAVQVTYDMDVTETRNVFQPDIIYNHGTGEFLGLVSPDGLSDDLSPPATVYTTEASEFLRIDRQKFHTVVKRIGELQREEKMSFMSKAINPLSSLPVDALEKVIPHVHKMEYPPNKTILSQEDVSDYLFFILSGRCQLSREVFIPEIERDVCFCLDSREQDDFFAEECILREGEGSICQVTTTSHTSCFLMHKSALEVVSKEMLLRVLESRCHYFPPDAELRDRGYRKCRWDGYKHHVVSESLRERGCLYILSRDVPEKVRFRPPSEESQHKENMLRFMAKGANYEPVLHRVRSATIRSSSNSLRCSSSHGQLRPRTAFDSIHPDLRRPSRLRRSPSPTRVVLQDREKRRSKGHRAVETDVEAAEKEDSVPEMAHHAMTSSDDAIGSTPVTSSFVRMLENNLPKAVLQKIIGNRGADMDPRLLGRAMEENPELGRQLRLAWEVHQQEKNDGFTKTTVLVTMKTDDIVRKAKAMAEKQSSTTDDIEEEDEDEIEEAEEGDDGDNQEGDDKADKKRTTHSATTHRRKSSLVQENSKAKSNIAGDKFRAAFLRRKIHGLQQRRVKEKAQLLYRAAIPGHVPTGAELEGSRGGREGRRSLGDSFYLDDLQKKYQGLDPDEASKKVSCMGYQVLFVSRLRRRCRSLHDISDTAGFHTATSKSDNDIRLRSADSIHRVSQHHLRLHQDQRPEAVSMRRRSAEDARKPGVTGHASIRKDAPVTLRSLTIPPHTSGTEGDSSSSSSPTSRRASRDNCSSLSGEGPPRKHLPYPKLQLNR